MVLLDIKLHSYCWDSLKYICSVSLSCTKFAVHILYNFFKHNIVYFLLVRATTFSHCSWLILFLNFIQTVDVTLTENYSIPAVFTVCVFCVVFLRWPFQVHTGSNRLQTLQRSPALVLVAHCRAWCRCFLASTHLIEICESPAQKFFRFGRRRSMTHLILSGVLKQESIYNMQDTRSQRSGLGTSAKTMIYRCVCRSGRRTQMLLPTGHWFVVSSASHSVCLVASSATVR